MHVPKWVVTVLIALAGIGVGVGVAAAANAQIEDHSTEWDEDRLLEQCVHSKTSSGDYLIWLYNSQDEDGSDMSMFVTPLAEGKRCG